LTLFGFDFILSPDAAGTQVHSLRFTIDLDGSGMYVSIEAAIGMLLGMANVLTKHWGFPTDVTLQNRYSLDYWP
jgi:hypothetical protein